jgi:GNAT superfamily N-acetyltransferase
VRIQGLLMSFARVEIRAATPADIPALRRMKMRLLAFENSLHVATASEADWRRDGFGPAAKFTALVADVGGVTVGMAIYSARGFPGWRGTSFFLHDLYVEKEHRGRGCARALMARLAADAKAQNAAFIELTVDKNNSAREFYRRLGFAHVSHCMTYVAARPAIQELTTAAKSKPRRFSALKQAS